METKIKEYCLLNNYEALRKFLADEINEDIIYRYAVEENLMDLINWLLQLNILNNYLLFRLVCITENRIELIKQLWKLTTYHTQIHGFYQAVLNGCTNNVYFFLSRISKYSIEVAFNYACESNKEELVQYFLNKNPNSSPWGVLFEFACRNNNKMFFDICDKKYKPIGKDLHLV